MAGEVKRPGIVTIKDDATLDELIAAAGGVDEFADIKRVSLTYNGITQLIDSSEAGDTKVMPGAVVKVARILMRTDDEYKRRLDELGKDGSSGLNSLKRLKGE